MLRREVRKRKLELMNGENEQEEQKKNDKDDEDPEQTKLAE